MAGHWTFTRDRDIGLTVDRVDVGGPKAVGRAIGMGRVRAVDDAELVRSTVHGDDRFTRP